MGAQQSGDARSRRQSLPDVVIPPDTRGTRRKSMPSLWRGRLNPRKTLRVKSCPEAGTDNSRSEGGPVDGAGAMSRGGEIAAAARAAALLAAKDDPVAQRARDSRALLFGDLLSPVTSPPSSPEPEADIPPAPETSSRSSLLKGFGRGIVSKDGLAGKLVRLAGKLGEAHSEHATSRIVPENSLGEDPATDARTTVRKPSHNSFTSSNSFTSDRLPSSNTSRTSERSPSQQKLAKLRELLGESVSAAVSSCSSASSRSSSPSRQGSGSRNEAGSATMLWQGARSTSKRATWKPDLDATAAAKLRLHLQNLTMIEESDQESDFSEEEEAPKKPFPPVPPPLEAFQEASPKTPVPVFLRPRPGASLKDRRRMKDLDLTMPGVSNLFMDTSPNDLEGDYALAVAQMTTSNIPTGPPMEAGGYICNELLGMGGNCEVRRAIQVRSGFSVAIKMMRRPDEEYEEVLRQEYEVLKSLSHPNVVKVHELFVTSCGYAMLVLQYIPGRQLSDLIKLMNGLSEGIAKSLTRQLTRALVHVHRHGVVHRDIKPDNVMVTQLLSGKRSALDAATVVLIDFNVSAIASESDPLLTQTGTPEFQSPELAAGMVYDKSVDIWALGATSYCMIAGAFSNMYSIFAFHDLPLHEVLRIELREETAPVFTGAVWDGVSRDCKSYISDCLKVVASVRLSAPKLAKHPWLKDGVRRARKKHHSNQLEYERSVEAAAELRPAEKSWALDFRERERVTNTLPINSGMKALSPRALILAPVSSPPTCSSGAAR